jgi:hypothetical protein
VERERGRGGYTNPETLYTGERESREPPGGESVCVFFLFMITFSRDV